MTVKLHAAAAQLLAALALIGCSGGGPDVPTPDEAARADYARIAGAANIVMFGDVLGYRAGSAEPERVPVACNGKSCSIGFGRPFGSGSFSVDSVKLRILPDRNGVREVVERKVSDTVEVTVFGGWMKHGFFGSQVNLVKDGKNPNHGATVLYSYAIGYGAGKNPAVPRGTASWQGFVVGRDAGAAGNLESVVKGDAVVSVRLGQPDLRADVAFTGLSNEETGARYSDMAWRGMTVSDGAFGQYRGAGDRLEGRFFGPKQEEAGGVFERAGIAGAFGAKRGTE